MSTNLIKLSMGLLFFAGPNPAVPSVLMASLVSDCTGSLLP